ncbi:hypothetical protein CARUB_v10015043mg [Capsella rubella]|uniref:Uncharacterized protein n=1 Tax=Capsella rubella TaxID=81985 RepID=R0I1P3_9BRAS|nr:hypothetical protein CARUB_v10015043mg [Capsella rubella]EOA31821.1 hypothetical protein CARUB_v10015043mg [Capsella rubella]
MYDCIWLRTLQSLGFNQDNSVLRQLVQNFPVHQAIQMFSSAPTSILQNSNISRGTGAEKNEQWLVDLH